MNDTNQEDPALEAEARRRYEDSRKIVAGRPAWEDLDPDCPYDMGMKAYAFTEARKSLGLPEA